MAEAEDFSGRLEELKLLWESDPTAKVYLQLTEEYRRLGRIQDAIQVLEKTLAQRPRDPRGRVLLARCRMDLGQTQEAARILEEITKMDPAHAVASKLLLECYLLLHDAEKAAERFNLYRLLNDRDPELDHLEYRLRRLQSGESEVEERGRGVEVVTPAAPPPVAPPPAPVSLPSSPFGAAAAPAAPADPFELPVSPLPSVPPPPRVADPFDLTAPLGPPSKDVAASPFAWLEASAPAPHPPIVAPLPAAAPAPTAPAFDFAPDPAPPPAPSASFGDLPFGDLAPARGPAGPGASIDLFDMLVATSPAATSPPSLDDFWSATAATPFPPPAPATAEPEPSPWPEPYQPVSLEVAEADAARVEEEAPAEFWPNEAPAAESWPAAQPAEPAFETPQWPDEAAPAAEAEVSPWATYEAAPAAAEPSPWATYEAAPAAAEPSPWAVHEAAPAADEPSPWSSLPADAAPAVFESWPVDEAPSAVEPPPEDLEATATLGDLYLLQGHIDEAAAIFQQVLIRDPGNATALAGMARLQALRSDWFARGEAAAPAAPDAVTAVAVNVVAVHTEAVVEVAMEAVAVDVVAVDVVAVDVVAVTGMSEPPVRAPRELKAADLLADRTAPYEIPAGLTAKKILVLKRYLQHLRSARPAYVQ